MILSMNLYTFVKTKCYEVSTPAKNNHHLHNQKVRPSYVSLAHINMKQHKAYDLPTILEDQSSHGPTDIPSIVHDARIWGLMEIKLKLQMANHLIFMS